MKHSWGPRVPFETIAATIIEISACLRRAGYTNVFTTMGKIVANEGAPCQENPGKLPSSSSFRICGAVSVFS